MPYIVQNFFDSKWI